MPFTAVKRLVRTESLRRGTSKTLRSGTKDYREVVASVSTTFGVSQDAAKYRLQKLGLVSAAAGKKAART
jgi:Zn-dependent peptidase ImmA (M78 family)